MKILHVVGCARLESGGPIEGVRQRAAILIEMGHTVEIASLDAPGLNEFDLKVHALGPGRGGYQYCQSLAPWLRSHMAEFDAVIVNGIWQYHGWAVREEAKRINKPYFVFAHGMLDPWFRRTYRLKHLKKLLYWPWQHAVLRDARAVLFTTEEERILARESFRPYEIVERVVPYGTAAAPPPCEAQETAFHSKVPEAQGRRVILYLGRIHPKKGLDLLISAFAKVFESEKAWVLVAAGPDQTGWKPDLVVLATKLGIADRVLWPGMLSDDAKWGAFRAAEAFALPSHQENFGIAVAEALSCGTPVLISDKVNIWREVSAAEAGLVAADTLEGTVELLQKFKALPADQLKKMGEHAVECFAKNFEASQMAVGLLNVIAELGH